MNRKCTWVDALCGGYKTLCCPKRHNINVHHRLMECNTINSKLARKVHDLCREYCASEDSCRRIINACYRGEIDKDDVACIYNDMPEAFYKPPQASCTWPDLIENLKLKTKD